MSNIDYILGPPILGAVFLLLGWPYARLLRAGQPLTEVQQEMLRYGFFFVLGMGYAMVLAASLGIPGKWALALTGAWGAALAWLAWYRQSTRQVRGRQTAENVSHKDIDHKRRQGED